MKHSALLSTVLLTALASPAISSAQTQQITTSPLVASTSVSVPSATSVFAPNPQTRVRLDYEVWDQLLKDFVMYTGPSLRQRATRPRPVVGTRFVHGHTSPYRMEGNRIVFEEINDEYAGAIKAYAADLIDIGNRIDIARMPRNEQLAYWMNLHNALVIDTIMDNYPVERPSRIKGADGESFHDMTLATIKGVPISLRTIREDIVYRHWNDPMVIYGFFLGDIGSPSIQRAAFTAQNVNGLVRFSGSEFANSLRGFELRKTDLMVSQLYYDAAPYFFPDFETDVRAHLRKLVGGDAKSEFSQARGDMRIAKYDTTIVDLTAADGDRLPISNVQSDDGENIGLTRGPMSRQLQEFNRKFEQIRTRGLNGTVVIEDIDTDETAPTSAPPPTRATSPAAEDGPVE